MHTRVLRAHVRRQVARRTAVMNLIAHSR
jgi:hypothetical protein